ncbi:MAG TPA: hypothetical protein VF144_07680 [Chitinophagaceae bacterium]
MLIIILHAFLLVGRKQTSRKEHNSADCHYNQGFFHCYYEVSRGKDKYRIVGRSHVSKGNRDARIVIVIQLRGDPASGATCFLTLDQGNYHTTPV